MFRVSIINLQPGMEVARDVVSAEGRFLIRKGVTLTFHYIQRLREIGVGSVYIVSHGSLPDYTFDVLSDQTRIKAIQTVRNAFDKFKMTRKMEAKVFRELAVTIVDELLGHPDALLHLTDIRTHDDYTFGHSVNVGVLAVLTGIALGYSRKQLQELAIGCLLHDLGKMSVPLDILNKPGTFTEQEMETMKTHSEAGFDILRKNPGVPLLSAHIAFQHHERFNGTGYPRGLKGQEIHEYSRIAAVADAYDALTSDRPYRKGMLPHEAYEIMIASAGEIFEESLLQKFFEHVALYPLGTVVTLNSGETGVVIECINNMPLRPGVRILLDQQGRQAVEGRRIELAMETAFFISKVLDETEVLQLYNDLQARDGEASEMFLTTINDVRVSQVS